MPIDPELAARLTLLFMRAAVPAEVKLREGVCAVGAGTPAVTTAEAARRLAAMRKPLASYATVEGDLLVVELRLPEQWRRMYLSGKDERVNELWDERHRELYGDDYRGKYVLCVGRGEWELATFEELDEWERDYPFMGSGGCGGGPFDPALEGTDRAAPEAIAAAGARGAVHVRWYAAGAVDDGLTGRISCTRYEPTDSAPPCERCDQRQARYVVHWFDESRPARSLCQRCIDEELTVHQFDEARSLDRRRAQLLVAERTKDRQELAELAEELAMFWALSAKPPFIRDFIARYRASP